MSFKTSPNRVYLASANAFAQIQPYGWTSDTLDTLGINILDHLIITNNGWLSFKQKGLI